LQIVVLGGNGLQGKAAVMDLANREASCKIVREVPSSLGF